MAEERDGEHVAVAVVLAGQQVEPVVAVAAESRADRELGVVAFAVAHGNTSVEGL